MKNKRSFAWLAALLGLLAFRVEDGQFTREYSRIYAALVLSIVGVLVLGVIVAVWRSRRRA